MVLNSLANHGQKNLTNLEIKRKYTAIRNPCMNLAERMNRQLGNIFPVLVGGHHTKWFEHID